MAGSWICFGDPAAFPGDVGHPRKGTGKDGAQVFGLAVGKKKLPLTDLGKIAIGIDDLAGTVGGGQKSELGFGYVMFGGC